MSLEEAVAANTAAVGVLTDNIRQLIQVYQQSGLGTSVIDTTAPAEPKKGPGRPAGSTKKEAPANQPSPGASTAATSGGTKEADPFGEDPFADAPSQPTYNLEQIRSALKNLATAENGKNKAAAMAVLSKRNYKGVGEIKEGDIAEIVKEITAAGGKIG
jgi:hypothetical protein